MNKNNILWKARVIKIIYMLSICVLLVACNQESSNNNLISEEKEEEVGDSLSEESRRIEEIDSLISDEQEETEAVSDVLSEEQKEGDDISSEEEGETSDATSDVLKEMELNNVKVYPAVIRIDNYNTDYNIEYPNIDVKSGEMLEIFNKQIYNVVFPESLRQYDKYTRWADITYEITFFNERFLEIHFTGETAYIGSYVEFNRGVLFNLETGEIMSLSDFYSLPEIKEIIYDAWEKEEIKVLKLHLTEEDIKGIIKDFVDLFDTDEYICQTDNFYISENHIYFLALPPESMRQRVYIQMDIEKFPAIY